MSSEPTIISEQRIVKRDRAPEPPVGEMATVVHMLERAAANPDIDIDKMERLFKLRKEMLQETQQQAYNTAMARAQAGMKPVIANSKNLQTNSMYAKLDKIIAQAAPIYTAEGFSLSFDMGDCPKEGHIRILCDVMHSGGWVEHKHYDLAPDGVGIKGNANKTPIHADSSSVSYGRRYLTCMIFNIPVGDDNDGNRQKKEGDEPPRISEKQVLDITTMLKDMGADKAQFLKAIKAESVEAIRASSYDAVIGLIKQRQAAKAATK